ncbi:hypothetical protein BaRGS_00035602, partial [Batillaria attramentaria]
MADSEPGPTMNAVSVTHMGPWAITKSQFCPALLTDSLTNYDTDTAGVQSVQQSYTRISALTR